MTNTTNMTRLLQAVGLVGVVLLFLVPVIGSRALVQDLFGVLTLPQIGPILPYLLLVLVLVFRPQGLMGKRDV